jgi:hypothetical protein
MRNRACIIIIGVMLISAGTVSRCYSQDGAEENAAMAMQGNVTAIDWVGSVITINDIEFFVPSDVVVRKGTDPAGFSDINVGDSATVTYSKEKDGSLKAVRVVVAYSGEMPT